MARATAFVGGLVLGVVLGTAVMVSHADPASADVQAAAEQANVEPSELLAAMDSTGIGDPFRYLRAVGELSPLAALPSRPASSPTAPALIWDRLAACESTSNWHANTGNGFLGGLQFTLSTWRAYGGVGSPAQASREAQIAVAERVLVGQGWRAWPVCSRVIGLR